MALQDDEEADVLAAIPPNYKRRLRLYGKNNRREAVEVKPLSGFQDFRKTPNLKDTARIVHPLPEEVEGLLARHRPNPPSPSPSPVPFPDSDSESNWPWHDTTDPLASSLHNLLWSSEKLWESPIRGIVLKCSASIAVKVITSIDHSRGDYTEYTTMQYLAEHAPDIPVPIPHGLIKLGQCAAIFMSYMGDMTLTAAWPGLGHEEKVGVREQLEGICGVLRGIRKDDGGGYLGRVAGEGVKDLPKRYVSTVGEFDEVRFSVKHRGSSTYTRFLRWFLTEPVGCEAEGGGGGLVFSHGDLRKDSITVKLDENGKCIIVTGIIDWEYAGFYPEWYESTQLTRTMGSFREDDWHLYLPECINPARYKVRWLVDRLWMILVGI